MESSGGSKGLMWSHRPSCLSSRHLKRRLAILVVVVAELLCQGTWLESLDGCLSDPRPAGGLAFASMPPPREPVRVATAAQADDKSEDAEVNYEDAFKSRLKKAQVEKPTPAKAKADGKDSSSGMDFIKNIGNVEAPKGNNNFLSLPEWQILLNLFGFIAFVTVVVFIAKSAG
mmetsp:Transcript_42507/g.77143  ORF Transcript_42507/g.77143 Transcript_42507/m.77143 type:complete len:173 (-) Transcript_42507:211-729(-)